MDWVQPTTMNHWIYHTELLIGVSLYISKRKRYREINVISLPHYIWNSIIYYFCTLFYQVPDSPDVAKKKMDIDNTIRAKLAVDFDHHRKSRPKHFPLHAVGFHYKPEESGKTRHKNDSLPVNVVDIKSEILRLTSQVRTLEEELDELRTEQQQNLESFAESLTNVVCIPPMSEKATLLGWIFYIETLWKYINVRIFRISQN